MEWKLKYEKIEIFLDRVTKLWKKSDKAIRPSAQTQYRVEAHFINI